MSANPHHRPIPAPQVGVVRVEAVEAAPFRRIIFGQTRTFSHKQEYKFKFHRLKANILCKRDCFMVRRYLWRIADNRPNELFQNSDGAMLRRRPPRAWHAPRAGGAPFRVWMPGA